MVSHQPPFEYLNLNNNKCVPSADEMKYVLFSEIKKKKQKSTEILIELKSEFIYF